MTHSRLPTVRRVSQILFFAAFLFLLFRSEFSGSFRGAGGEVRLPWPVSIFLEADPLAALTTAISTGTLYRGLLWSLVILVPTFFLGRFFCGWICPLGTLNHFFGSFKSEKKRGKALLESNRYKPWQAIEVLRPRGRPAVGLVRVAARRPGRSDPAHGPLAGAFVSCPPPTTRLARLIDRLYSSDHHARALRGRGAAVRPAGHAGQLQAAALPPGRVHRPDLHVRAGAEPAGDALLVPRRVPARRPARRRLALVARSPEKGPGRMRRLPPLPAALPGRRRPDSGAGMAQGGMPPVLQLRRRLPHSRRRASPSARRRRDKSVRETPEAAAPKADHRRGRRRRPGPAPADDHGPEGRSGFAPHSSAGRARRDALPRALHPLRRVHEGVPEQRPAPDLHGSRPRGAMDAGARAARRLLRAELRPVRPGVPHRSDLGNHRGAETGSSDRRLACRRGRPACR